MLYRLFRSFLFGNYFYGICAVALSVESAVQLGISLNSLAYYLVVFAATVVYYTFAYTSDANPNVNNQRSVWYMDNRGFVRFSQITLGILFTVSLIIFIAQQQSYLFAIPFYYWLLFFIFPLTAVLYYGSQSPVLRKYNLRDTGWMKPFVIGFVWAGAVSVYPVVFSTLAEGNEYHLSLFKILLFIKNFMYITVLCIMFDIKDYAEDHNRQLKTFVVRVGLRKTIYSILLPLCTIGLGTFLVYAYSQHFPLIRVVMNTIPFVLLILVAYSLNERKHILYYLAVIDGLMLVKAACGVMGMVLVVRY